MGAMGLSRALTVGGLGLLLLVGTGCPSGVTEAGDAGVDVGQQDRPAQQDAPPFSEDAAGGEGGTSDGPATPDGGPCYPEPDESTGGDTCAEALDRGSVSFSATTHLTISGNLWPDGDEDWYKVAFVDSPTAADCGKFKARIAFTQNPGDHFRFEPKLDSCTAQATCATVTVGDAGVPATDAGVPIPAGGLTNFTLNGTPGCPCVPAGSTTSDNVHVCNDYSVTLRIRVFRTTGAPVLCENYELSIDNG
jgi:hypothetical protein